MRLSWIGIVGLFALAGCSTSQKSATPESGGGDMVSKGAGLYADQCAHCHGDNGEGSKKAPPVVGAEALPLDPRPGSKRNIQFRTAADVYAWVKANMPGDEPGSLTDDQYLAILAFDLSANGVALKDKSLDEATASNIVLHQ